MRFAIFAILISTAAAFTAPSMTFAVAKKSPAKKVAAAKKVVAKAAKKAVVAAKKVAPKKVTPKKVAPKVVASAKKVAKKAVVAKKVVAKKVAVAKKVVAKKAAVVKKTVAKAAPKPIASRAVGVIPSTAIPGEEAPALLDGSLVGDVGFDPCFLSTKADTIAPYFNGIFENKVNLDGLSWYREAELMHGRICMVAVVGFIAPGFGTFAGNDWTGFDAYSYTNPLEALSKAPGAALFQIFSFMAILEFRRINFILEEGSRYMPGDAQKWGQGPGRWNPLGLSYTPAEYEEKQLQEIKHARLAMIGLLGLIFQANASGVGVVDQLGKAFVSPEFSSKAGYFFPEGI